MRDLMDVTRTLTKVTESCYLGGLRRTSDLTLRGSLLPELLGVVLWKSTRKGSHHLLYSFSSVCCG